MIMICQQLTIPHLNDVLSELRVDAVPEVSFTLFSGGAEGVDTVFDEVMSEHAPEEPCFHWSFDAHRDFRARPQCRVNLPESMAARIADPHLAVAAKRLGQSMPRNPAVRALFRRNVFQVLWADEVYVVTWEDPDASYPLRIGGGTKWTAQVYIDRFEPIGIEPAAACKLLWYEVNSGKWKVWNQTHQHWLEQSLNASVKSGLSQPLCTPLRFAGIGTRSPPDHAVVAIKALFRNVGFKDTGTQDLQQRRSIEDVMLIGSGGTAQRNSLSQDTERRRRWGMRIRNAKGKGKDKDESKENLGPQAGHEWHCNT